MNVDEAQVCQQAATRLRPGNRGNLLTQPESQKHTSKPSQIMTLSFLLGNKSVLQVIVLVFCFIIISVVWIDNIGYLTLLLKE